MALRNRFERISRGEKLRPSPDRLTGNASEQGGSTARFLHVALDRIERDHDQPRKDLGDLEGLKASIKEDGILVPLIVTPLDEDRFQLVAGERRLTAAHLLGMTEVPVLVRTVEEHQRLVVQILENLHRKDLTPVEEAQGVRRLMEETSLTQRQVATRLGKSLSSVNELLRILDLPAAMLDEVRKSPEVVTKSVLLEIAKEPDAQRRQTIWRRVRSGEGLTVQRARQAKRASGEQHSRRPQTESVTSKPESGGHRLRRDLPAAAPAGQVDWSVQTTLGTVSVLLHTPRKSDQAARDVRRALIEALDTLRREGPDRPGAP